MSGAREGPVVVGVVSDTHGKIHPGTLDALAGVGRIVHAGDVGEGPILERLAAIAPVTAVRGNVDRTGAAARLPATEVVEIDGLLLYVLHDLAELDLDPTAAGFAAVISGHTHVPKIERRRDVLYLNPGSCGPRRFNLPLGLARLTVGAGRLSAELVTLVPGRRSSARGAAGSEPGGRATRPRGPGSLLRCPSAGEG